MADPHRRTMGTSEVTTSTTARIDRSLGAADVDAFVREHHERLVRLARLVCRDPTEASDAVQTALEQAWRRRDALRDPAALRGWLDRIVVREAIRMDRRRRFPLARLLGRTGEAIEVADPRAPSATVRTDLQAAFEGLPAAQRAVVVLHLHYGYSIVETAAIVGAPTETVRSRLRLGTRRLRAVLEDAGS